MTAEFRKKVDEAIAFWKNEESDTLLSLLCEYSREVAYASASHDCDRKEENEVNVWAIQKVLRARLEAK